MDIEKIRMDFPCLNRLRFGKPPIYFDNACVTLKPSQVVTAMDKYYYDFPACGGHRSGHWFAQEVQEATEKAREKIREFINAREPTEYLEDLRKSRGWYSEGGKEELREIIWTRNTTEGLNLVSNSFNLNEGDFVLITDKEHNSNLAPWQELERKKRVRYAIIDSNEDNTFNIQNFHEKMSEKVKLVSIVHTSNLDGYTIPDKDIIEIAETAHDSGAKVMLDCAQSVPHKKLDVQKLDVDFIAFSAHKMCGPAGMGVLYAKIEELINFDPFIVGGETVKDTWYRKAPVWLDPPAKYEAGLQNYAGQIGFGTAADYLMEIGVDNISVHESKLNEYLKRQLKNYDIDIIGSEDPKSRSGICTFIVKTPFGGENGIGAMLNEYSNIMVRTGYFCVNSWFNERKNDMMCATAVRVSLYLYNTLEECKVFIETLDKILNEPFVRDSIRSPINHRQGAKE